MNIRLYGLAFAMVSAALPSYGQSAADHLVLSEIGIAVPGGSQFVEIYNPTAAPVNLTNYYFSDHHTYFDLPSIVSGQITNTLANGSDHLLQLPAGMIIPAGGTVVVTDKADELLRFYFDGDITKFTGQPGSPQLVEVNETLPGVPNIATNYNKTSPEYPLDREGALPVDSGNNLSHTDGDENTVLFYWDGQGPLVEDIDIVQWREDGSPWGDSSNQITNKSGVVEQGPNGTPGSYAFDFGNSDNLTVWHDVGNYLNQTTNNYYGQIVRRSLVEAGETQSGGNGIEGDDETLEQIALTWRMVYGTSSNASPGTTELGLSASNHPPVVGKSSRNVQRPVPGNVVHITAPIYDDGTFTGKLMVDKGTGTFTATNMTSEGNNIFGADISTAGLAEGTHVKWYVSATDSGNLTASEADYVKAESNFPGYHVFMVKTGSYQPTDIIVSEVMYNPEGGNNFHHAQYIELYNPAATPLNVGSFVIGTDTYLNKLVTIPEGTVIPGNGYLIITARKSVFMRVYPGLNEAQVIDFEIVPEDSFIAHAGSTLQFYDPNVFGFDETPVDRAAAAFKTFSYTNVAPWPVGTTGPDIGAGNTGYSIELTNLTSADEQNPASWAVSTVYNGTPLALNSQNEILRPGDLEVTTATRNIVFPSTAQPVIITAVTSSTLPVTSAQIFVNSGAGFTPSPMVSADGGLTWTAVIGPFPVDKSLVKYYVVATNNAGNTGSFPYTAPVTSVPFMVQNVPSLSNDIIINEIMYDPGSNDNNNAPEYVELYNRSDAAVNLSYYQYGNSLPLDHYLVRTFPEGTIVPSKGYVVVAAQEQLFVDFYVSDFGGFNQRNYGPVDPNIVFDMGWQPTSTFSNGDASTFHLVHPNQVDFYGLTDGVPFASLNYKKSAPWPANGTNINGPSYELKDPGLINSSDPNSSYQNHDNWAISKSFSGTPGNRNSVTAAASQVSDWTLY